MEATGEQAAQNIWQARLHILNNGEILYRMLKLVCFVYLVHLVCLV